MKKVSFITVALISGLLFTTCDLLNKVAGDKKPEVTLKSVEFTAIDFEGLTLTSTVDVKNNISIDIPLPKFDWNLSVIGNPFVDGIIQSEGPLESGKSKEVSFPVSFTYANLITTIVALANNEEDALYKIEMLAHIPVPGMRDFSFPFEHEGKIPIMRAPEIKVVTAPKAEIINSSILGIPTPTSANIKFDLSVKNNGNVAVKLNELAYDFKINNVSISNGGVSNKPEINPGGTETLSFSFPVSFTQVALAVLQGNFDYTFTGTYLFGIPDFPLLGEVGDSFNFQK